MERSVVHPDHRPDLLEYAVRFVCGALFGGGMALWHLMGDPPASAGWTGLEIAVPGLVIGALAAWLGDRLWLWLGRLGSW